jgi:hypothetical protein
MLLLWLYELERTMALRHQPATKIRKATPNPGGT